VKTDSGDTAKLEYENRTLQDCLSSYELERTEMKREIEWMQQELEQQKSSPLTINNESTEQEQQYELAINKKQQRIEELEHAVRESLQITTEREYAMTQQKRKVENLEKQVQIDFFQFLYFFLCLDKNSSK
jgi:ELKS/RAB6-interacting/CAST family protein 1